MIMTYENATHTCTDGRTYHNKQQLISLFAQVLQHSLTKEESGVSETRIDCRRAQTINTDYMNHEFLEYGDTDHRKLVTLFKRKSDLLTFLKHARRPKCTIYIHMICGLCY